MMIDVLRFFYFEVKNTFFENIEIRIELFLFDCEFFDCCVTFRLLCLFCFYRFRRRSWLLCDSFELDSGFDDLRFDERCSLLDFYDFTFEFHCVFLLCFDWGFHAFRAQVEFFGIFNPIDSVEFACWVREETLFQSVSQWWDGVDWQMDEFIIMAMMMIVFGWLEIILFSYRSDEEIIELVWLKSMTY